MNRSSRILPLLTGAVLATAALTHCGKASRAERSIRSALEFFEKGDFAAAEIEIKNTLAADPNNPTALKYFGLMCLRQGATATGARALASADALRPEDDEVAVALAQAMLDLGFSEDCRARAREMIQRDPRIGEAWILLVKSATTPELVEEIARELEALETPDRTPESRLALALLAVRRGESEEGLKLADQVCREQPELVEAHTVRSIALDALGDKDQALEASRKAAALAPERSPESITLAKRLASLGQGEEAGNLLVELTEKTPDFLPAWQMRAMLAFQNGHSEQAAKWVAKVLAREPFDLGACILKAEILMKSGAAAEAVKLLERTHRAFPGRPPLELALAQAELAAGENQRAGARIERIVAANPGYTIASLYLGGFYLNDRKPEQAIRVLQDLLRRQGDHQGARGLLVQAYRAVGRHEEAVQLLQPDVERLDLKGRLMLADSLRQTGRLPEARTLLEQVASEAPDEFDVLRARTSLELSEGRIDEALQLCNVFLERVPEPGLAMALKADFLIRAGQREEADALLVKAIEAEPGLKAAYTLLMQLRLQENRASSLIPVLQKLLELHPDDPEARLQLGFFLLQDGKSNEARSELQRIIEEHPESASAHNNLASVELEAFDNARLAFESAVRAHELDPDSAAICDTLGWTHYLLGEPAKARPLLEKAVEGLPHLPGVRSHLGETYYALGQTEQARENLEAALKLASKFPEKESTQATLERLRGLPTASLDQLQARVGQHPEDLPAQLALAEAFSRAGMATEALATFDRAIALNPQLELGHIGKAKLYAGALQLPDKALESALSAQKLAPQNPAVLAVLGSVRLLKSDFEAAYGLLKEAAARAPSPEIHQQIAQAAYAIGRIEESRAEMAQALEGPPGIAAAARRFLSLTSPPAEGIAPLVEATLKQDPDHLAALMARAELETAAGQSPEASYRRVLELAPSFDPARIRLLQQLLKDPGNLEAAEKLFRDLRRSLTDDPEVASVRGSLAFLNGDFATARSCFNEVARSRSLHPRERHGLAVSLAKTGKTEEARPLLKLSLEDPLSPAQRELVRSLLETTEDNARPSSEDER